MPIFQTTKGDSSSRSAATSGSSKRRNIRGWFANRRPFERVPQVPKETYSAVRERLQHYNNSRAAKDDNNNKTRQQRSTAVPEARYNRDEIMTGASVSLESHNNHHENSPIHKLKPKRNFEYYDVTGIRMQTSDPTETLTDMSMSMSMSRMSHTNGVHDRHLASIPQMGPTDEEEARHWVAAQTFEVPRHHHKATTTVAAAAAQKKPLHKYMLKQVHPDCCPSRNGPSRKDSLDWMSAITHLVRETQLFKEFGHQHHNLLTLRGTTLDDEEIFLDSEVQWDSYFLLTDHISETLGQRIGRWRLESMDRPSHSPADDGVGNWLCSSSVPASHSPTLDSNGQEFPIRLVYAQTLASVLAFLHSKQIIVRNLNPESIGFLASDDSLQLLDLGQALLVGDAKPSTKTIIGNPTTMLQQQHTEPLFRMTPGHVMRFMAPEVLIRPPTAHCGFSVDSYSWAMVCFEMFTLSEPFATLKPGQHLVHVCLERPSRRPRLLELYQFPRRLERLLQGAWHEDAKRRYDMADIDQRMQKLLGAAEESTCTSMQESKTSSTAIASAQEPIVFPRHRAELPRSA